jgi:Cyclin, N-terminal domain/Cyclin, C-terminal domain
MMDIDEPDFGSQAGILADNFHAMLRQERSGKYECTDYLSVAGWQGNVYQMMKKPKFEMQPSHGSSSPTTTTTTRIDEFCREQIVEWSFRVVDYFRIDREVVAVSLSYLDRFLATCRCDRTSFKLAATTTLHLAVKLLYPCKLADLGILSDLSRGEFDMKDVCSMESHILHTLAWNLHPPTAVAFSAIFLDYFFASRVVSISSTDLDDVYDVSSFFSELAVCDYYFLLVRSSTIALAAILDALEGMYGPENSLSVDIIEAARELHMGVPHDLMAARNRLWELYERSEECALHNDTVSDEDPTITGHGSIFVKKKPSTLCSPVSVSKPCHSATDFHCSSHEIMIRNESW